MPKTVLIADDNADMRSLLGYQLESRGYRVVMAVNGNEVLEKCRLEKPDVVLLDMVMPGKNGAEAGQELKKDPSTRAIPVIFLTAFTGVSAEGCETLPKNTTLDELVSTIEKVLNNK